MKRKVFIGLVIVLFILGFSICNNQHKEDNIYLENIEALASSEIGQQDCNTSSSYKCGAGGGGSYKYYFTR